MYENTQCTQEHSCRIHYYISFVTVRADLILTAIALFFSSYTYALTCVRSYLRKYRRKNDPDLTHKFTTALSKQ
jgi:hypothetical protein